MSCWLNNALNVAVAELFDPNDDHGQQSDAPGTDKRWWKRFSD